MVESRVGDASLLLDMKLAAEDVREFLRGVDEAAFHASRLHQNAVTRSLEVIGEAAGKVSPPRSWQVRRFPGAKSSACATG